jgi:hypothetical protein
MKKESPLFEKQGSLETGYEMAVETVMGGSDDQSLVLVSQAYYKQLILVFRH